MQTSVRTGLSVFDIRWLIINHLGIDQRGTRPALAALARVSLFSHLALNMLWRDLSDLSPIIRLFPQDLFILHRALGQAVSSANLDQNNG